jgi:hypothetical protein
MHDGDHWFVSSTGPAGKPRRLGARESRLHVDPTIHVEARVQRKGDRLQLGLAIRGADKRGRTIYRDDRRVTVTYKLLARNGDVLTTGTMNYG